MSTILGMFGFIVDLLSNYCMKSLSLLRLAFESTKYSKVKLDGVWVKFPQSISGTDCVCVCVCNTDKRSPRLL